MCSSFDSGLSFFKWSTMGFWPGVALALQPSSNDKPSKSFSACLGSASYSMPLSTYLMTLFNTVSSLQSLGPGPSLPPFLSSYFASS